MKRVNIDKEIKAKTIEAASKKFAKLLIKNGYEWAAEEMTECVEGGFYCMSNAMRHNVQKGVVNSPITCDWSYYWAIENVDGENTWYAWFIEIESNIKNEINA